MCAGSGGGNDGLAKGETEGTCETGPINILSWLPGRVTAIEMLTWQKTQGRQVYFCGFFLNSHWKTTGEKFTRLPV